MSETEESLDQRTTRLKEALFKAFLEIEITPDMLKPRPAEGWTPDEDEAEKRSQEMPE